MPRDERDNIIVGLDIGTTKVCAIIGELNEDGQINVIGIGNNPSRGQCLEHLCLGPLRLSGRGRFYGNL